MIQALTLRLSVQGSTFGTIFSKLDPRIPKPESRKPQTVNSSPLKPESLSVEGAGLSVYRD